MLPQVSVCPDVRSLNSSHTLFPTACTSRHFKPIGGVNSAHCTGDFECTIFESTKLLASEFPRRVAQWSSNGDYAIRHRLPLAQSASFSLLTSNLSAQRCHDSVEYTAGGADLRFTLKNLVVSTSGGTCFSKKTAIDFPAPCGAFWILG